MPEAGCKPIQTCLHTVSVYLSLFIQSLPSKPCTLIRCDESCCKPRWCPGRDSNPHAARRQNLNLLRLPISPPGLPPEGQPYRTTTPPNRKPRNSNGITSILSAPSAIRCCESFVASIFIPLLIRSCQPSTTLTPLITKTFRSLPG